MEEAEKQEDEGAEDKEKVMPEEQETINSGETENEADRLREENERLRAEIERVKKLPMKERLYDHINVSVKTIDIFIAVMAVLGILAIVVGMMK